MKKTLLSMMMLMSILGTQTINAATMESGHPRKNQPAMHTGRGQYGNKAVAQHNGYNAHGGRPGAPVPPPPPPPPAPHRPQGPHHRPTPPPPPPPPAHHYHHTTSGVGTGIIVGTILGTLIAAAAK